MERNDRCNTTHISIFNQKMRNYKNNDDGIGLMLG